MGILWLFHMFLVKTGKLIYRFFKQTGVICNALVYIQVFLLGNLSRPQKILLVFYQLLLLPGGLVFVLKIHPQNLILVSIPVIDSQEIIPHFRFQIIRCLLRRQAADIHVLHLCLVKEMGTEIEAEKEIDCQSNKHHRP